MATKKSTARKPSQEEIAAAVTKEREIHALQAEAGLAIADKLTYEIFGISDTGERASVALEVYDLLARDDEGEPLEDQEALRRDLTRASELSTTKLGASSPETVLEVYDRMFGSFDEAMEDEEDDE